MQRTLPFGVSKIGGGTSQAGSLYGQRGDNKHPLGRSY
ncbi:hypothetical protein AOT82_1115 [Psychrobacter sp. AntiMn-1]|nr:hypothetical protein AOT82_1115 [Psychrobacter sp. AntiMn-1]